MIALGLGTVQLGIPYGIRSEQGTLPEGEALQILSTAQQRGITFLDTARQYGESEKRIGQFLKTFPSSPFTIATKPSRVDESLWGNEKLFREFVYSQVESSLKALGTSVLDVLQLHQSELSFLKLPILSSTIEDLLREQKIKSAGVSVYSVEEAETALQLPWVSWLQVPVNLIDVRFLSPLFLERARKKGVRLIARSIFLQGILTSESDLPNVNRRIELDSLRTNLSRILSGANLTERSLAFIFANCRHFFDYGILGVHSEEELSANIQYIESCSPLSDEELEKLKPIQDQCSRTNLFDPRTWNKESIS